MRAFWAARTPREHVLIMVLGLISAAAVLIMIIWHPLQQHRSALRDDIARYSHAMATLSAIPAGAGIQPTATAELPLPSIITDTAATFQLAVRRLQPTENTADVTLEDAPFDAVLLWVDTLERDHGLRMVSLTLTRRPEPGVVAASLIVGR
jgi:general secretion pathway protein M